MTLPYIHTHFGKKQVLIGDVNGQFSKTHWSNTIRNKAAEKAKMPLPNCLRTPEKQELIMAMLANDFQVLGDENRWRFADAITNSPEESQYLWSNFMRSELWLLAAKSCNCQPIHLALAIGDMMKRKPEYFFETFPLDAQALTQFRKWWSGPIFPPLNCFTVDTLPYKPTGSDILRDYNGEWRAAITRYSGPSGNVFLYAARIARGFDIDYVGVGEIAPPALLYGRETVAANGSCPVLLSLSPEVSMALRKVLQEIPASFAQNFILLANYGSPDALYLGDICGRDVILLCSPDQEGWEMITKFAKRCMDNSVNSVKIYPYPVVGDFCPFGNRVIPAQAREKLLTVTTDLREFERISVLAKRIIEDSFPPEKLDAFEKRFSLNQDEIAYDGLAESSIQFLPWHSFDDANTAHDGPLTTRGFINPANTTLIYGQSDVGKSWLVIALCMALASGTEIFGLSASEPAKVFYLDGEVCNDFARRIRQLSQERSDTFISQLDKNFLVRSFTDSNELMQEKEQLMSLLRKEKPDVLVIDNILSLAPQAWRRKSEFLFDFLREIKAMGIAPIIVHHTDKKGDTYLGSVSLGSLSQNIIRLESLRPQDH